MFLKSERNREESRVIMTRGARNPRSDCAPYLMTSTVSKENESCEMIWFFFFFKNRKKKSETAESLKINRNLRLRPQTSSV